MTLILWVASACGGVEEEAAGVEEIIGGSVETGEPAVGSLVEDRGGGSFSICSGTIIGSNVVLTAAHCVYQKDAAAISFRMGNNAFEPTRTIALQNVYAHPSYDPNVFGHYDIGVAILAESAGISPVAYRTAELSASIVGRTMKLVGYGLSQSGGATPSRDNLGTKRSAQASVQRLDDLTFTHFISFSGGTCGGDSGGPALLDGEIIGVASFGDSRCVLDSAHFRVDRGASWVGQYAASAAPSAPPPTAPPPSTTPPPATDVCVQLGFYGNGNCDFWCPSPDPDC